MSPFVFMGGGARPDEAEAFVGGPTVLAEIKDAGLLVPVIQRHRLSLYDRVELSAAWEKWKQLQRERRQA